MALANVLGDPTVRRAVLSRVRDLAAMPAAERKVLVVHGPSGSGKRTVLRAAAAACGLACYEAADLEDLRALAAVPEKDPKRGRAVRGLAALLPRAGAVAAAPRALLARVETLTSGGPAAVLSLAPHAVVLLTCDAWWDRSARGWRENGSVLAVAWPAPRDGALAEFAARCAARAGVRAVRPTEVRLLGSFRAVATAHEMHGSLRTSALRDCPTDRAGGAFGMVQRTLALGAHAGDAAFRERRACEAHARAQDPAETLAWLQATAPAAARTPRDAACLAELAADVDCMVAAHVAREVPDALLVPTFGRYARRGGGTTDPSFRVAVPTRVARRAEPRLKDLLGGTEARWHEVPWPLTPLTALGKRRSDDLARREAVLRRTYGIAVAPRRKKPKRG